MSRASETVNRIHQGAPLALRKNKLMSRLLRLVIVQAYAAGRARGREEASS